MKYLFLFLSFAVIAPPFTGDARAADPVFQEFTVPEKISSPHSIAVDSSGNVWFAEKVGKNLTMFDPREKTFKVQPLPSQWGDVGPSRVALGPRGNVWFSVRRWAASEDDTGFLGQFDPAAGTFLKHPLAKDEGGVMRVDRNGVSPEDLLVDQNGVVWFLSPNENKLYSLDPGGAGLRGYTIPTPNSYPRGIAIDGAGVLWFSEANENKIGKFNPANATFNEYEIPTAFANPGTITVDGTGKVWFVEMSTNRLGVFYPDMIRFDEALIPTHGGMPNAIAADRDGKIWFLEYMGNKIGVFDPLEALFKEFDIPSPGSLPGDIAIDFERGRLWFSETNTETKKLGMLSIPAALPAGNEAASNAPASASQGASKAASGEGSYYALFAGFVLLAAAVTALYAFSRRRSRS